MQFVMSASILLKGLLISTLNEDSDPPSRKNNMQEEKLVCIVLLSRCKRLSRPVLIQKNPNPNPLEKMDFDLDLSAWPLLAANQRDGLVDSLKLMIKT